MILRIFLLWLVWSLSTLSAQAQQEFFPFLAEVTGKSVHIRAGQSANFESIGRLNKGDEVIVLERSFSWYKIRLPQSTGAFIHSDYIQQLSHKRGAVTANRINVRARPTTDATVVNQLKRGEEVNIVGSEGDWLQIAVPQDQVGWISEDFLVFKSKDVSAYEAKQQELAQIRRANLDAAEAERLEQERLKEATHKTVVVGILTEKESGEFTDLGYQLMIDGRLGYFVYGKETVFDRLLNYKVKIEGEVNDLETQYVHPVIHVSKIELVL